MKVGNKINCTSGPPCALAGPACSEGVTGLDCAYGAALGSVVVLLPTVFVAGLFGCDGGAVVIFRRGSAVQAPAVARLVVLALKGINEKNGLGFVANVDILL